MARFVNTAEGGTNGTAITTANTGGLSGTAWTTLGGGGSCVFTTTTPLNGSLSYLINEPTSQRYMAWDGLSVPKMAIRMYVRFASLPTASQDLMAILGGPKMQVLANTGVMRLVPNGGSSYDFPTALTANTTHRFEMFASIGGTSTTGTIVAAHFLGNDLTATDAGYDQQGSAQAGTVNYTGVRFGKLTGSVALNARFDDLCADTDITGLMGPAMGMALMRRTAAGAWNRSYLKIRTAGGTWDDVMLG